MKRKFGGLPRLLFAGDSLAASQPLKEWNFSRRIPQLIGPISILDLGVVVPPTAKEHVLAVRFPERSRSQERLIRAAASEWRGDF